MVDVATIIATQFPSSRGPFLISSNTLCFLLMLEYEYDLTKICGVKLQFLPKINLHYIKFNLHYI